MRMRLQAYGGCLTAVVALSLGACASFPEIVATSHTSETLRSGAGDGPAIRSEERPSLRADLIDVPAPPSAAARAELSPDQISQIVSDAPVQALLPPQALPQLVNTSLGEILGLPYTMGPGVASRTEVIALRGSGQMSQRQFLRMVQLGLRDYGLTLSLEGGVIQVSDAYMGNPAAPTIIRGAAPQAPTAARNVVQFLTVETIEVNNLVELVRGLAPNTSVTVTADPPSNSLLLRGGGREVVELVQIIRELDRPTYAGQQVLRVQPVYYTADNFAVALHDTLTAEGYQVSRIASARRAITILALPQPNQVLIFTRSPELLERAAYWAEQLDQPARLGTEQQTFVYQVQNTDAQTLGNLATGQSAPQSGIRSPVGVPGTPPSETAQANRGQPNSTGSSAEFRGGRVVIDPVGNRLLFTGTANEYAQLRTLLLALDTPPRQVLVEVTVAEVTLNDETRLGLEFFFNESMSDGVLTGGTEGGLGLGGGGLNLDFVRSDLRASFNAFASNNKVNILSRPRLVARSGGQARIQIGTDVPIVTSQRAADSSNDGTTDILQTIQYRQTGVILEIEPVVYGNNRVDLAITQEVSSQQSNSNSSIVSPLILNRSVTTQLSLVEGSTAVLGGLNDNSYTKGNTGIPFLKDIPELGSIFRTDTVTGDRTELIILVTPYIIRDEDDMNALAGRYTDDINEAFRIGRGWSYTLTPIGIGRGFGPTLPSVRSPSDRIVLDGMPQAGPPEPEAPEVELEPQT